VSTPPAAPAAALPGLDSEKLRERLRQMMGKLQK
jgi:hypothetical protein